MIGTKSTAEAADSRARASALAGGRRAFHVERSGAEKRHGLHGSDHADMSNENSDGNSERRNPESSWARFVHPGLVGPLAEAVRRR